MFLKILQYSQEHLSPVAASGLSFKLDVCISCRTYFLVVCVISQFSHSPTWQEQPRFVSIISIILRVALIFKTKYANDLKMPLLT